MDEEIKIATQVAQFLKRTAKTITTAESCTGGGISYALTEIAGSSAWFERAFITYSNQAKQEMLGVFHQDILTYGAVSETVVFQMAKGALSLANADFALAVSGIAGPSGGSEQKPVGSVCFAFASKEQIITQSLLFEGDRKQIRRATICHALNGLLLHFDDQK